MNSLQFNQRLLFGSIFIGYGFYILCRKCFSFVIPDVQYQENLTKEDLGKKRQKSLTSFLFYGFIFQERSLAR